MLGLNHVGRRYAVQTKYVRYRRGCGRPSKKKRINTKWAALIFSRGKKRIRVNINNNDRSWSSHTLNLHKDDNVYHPFLNELRDKGYWLPHWLDLHQHRQVESEPEFLQAPENVFEHHSSSEKFTDEGWKITKQR